MNRVILMGRLTRNPEIKHTADGTKIARYMLAVDRRTKDKTADFISCVAFEKTAEFAAKYLKKGTKILVTGRIHTGSYMRTDGYKVYTTDVLVEAHEFCERASEQPETETEGFMPIPEDYEDAMLPFC